MAKEKYFDIPHMRVCEGDLDPAWKGLRKPTDDDMKEIARQMSKAFMYDWNITLKIVANNVLGKCK